MSNQQNNQYINRLEKKSKIGWACFFKSENNNHRIHTEYCDKIFQLNNKLKDLTQLENQGIPIHIVSELKELYDLSKKEISCPICLDTIETNNIKFSSCGHKYCNNCLEQLKAQNNPKCAICRRKIY